MSLPVAPSLEPLSLKCPVCNAAFRGNEICPRCGSGLRQLMLLAARAWMLREMCREKLRAGDLAAALQYSEMAGQIQQPRRPADGKTALA